MKYILHFKDGHDERHFSSVIGIGVFYDAMPDVESWREELTPDPEDEARLPESLQRDYKAFKVKK